MKISLWPQNTIRFIKGFGFFGILIAVVISLFIAAITVPAVHASKIRAKHPIGSHVKIKGIGIEGTVAHYSDCACEVVIWTVAKNGKIENITVDSKMLEQFMKIKGILIGLGIIAVISVIATTITIGIVIPSYNQIQLQKQFPPGTPIVLKNLDIKGNVSEYTDHGVNILVIDKLGQPKTISVNIKLLTK